VRSTHMGFCARSATTRGNSTSASTLSIGRTPSVHKLETFADPPSVSPSSMSAGGPEGLPVRADAASTSVNCGRALIATFNGIPASLPLTACCNGCTPTKTSC
jgi:hypothetical protein